MSGLGSFIQGAFGGYSYGEQVKDNRAERKRREDRHGWEGDRQERLAEAHGWEEDRQERLAETHGWAREDRVYTGERRDRQREAWQREDDARQAHADAYEAARESYEGAQNRERGVIDGPTVSTRESAPGYDTERASPYMPSSPRGVMDEAPQAPPAAQTRPAQPGFDTGRASPVMRPGQQNTGPETPSLQQPERRSRGVIDPPQREPESRRSTYATNYNAPDRIMQAAREADGLEDMLNAGVDGTGQPLSDRDRTQYADMLAERDAMLKEWSGSANAPSKPGAYERVQTDANQPGAFKPGGNVRPPESGQAPQQAAPERPGRAPAPITREQVTPSTYPGIQQPAPRETPRQRPEPAPTERAAAAAPKEPQTAPQEPQAAPKPGAKGGEATGSVPVEAESSEQLDDRAANAPIEEGGAPSVEAASETVTRGVIGDDGAVRSSPEADAQAEESFMDHYAKVGAPQVIQHYLKTGQVDKAQAYEEWLNTREVQGQMRSWAGAVRAAAIGDERGFINKLAETYNAVDDGYTVDPENSGFTKDENGNVVGGQVTFRDERTGETFTRTYDDQSDLIEQGIYALAPEQMFEHLWSLNEKAQETRTAGVERQRERADSLSEKIRKEADSIRENQPLGGEPLTEQQIMQRAEENVRRQEEAAAGFASGAQSRQAPPNYRAEP